MKYFTPELLVRGNSEDEDVVSGIEDTWDRTIRRYNRRWARIKHAFPESVRRFDEARICLHDAEVLSMARQKDRFVMVMRQEPPSRDIVTLTFVLDGEMEIETGALPWHGPANRVFWMYEEFDLDRDKRCRFEVMLSNTCIVKLHFRKFQYVVAEAVNPLGTATAVPAAQIA